MSARPEPSHAPSASSPTVSPDQCGAPLAPAAPHATQPQALIAALTVDPERGLGRRDVEARRVRCGPNRLPEPPRPSEVLRFVRQLGNPLVLTLLAAAAVTIAVALSRAGAGGSTLSRFGDAIAITTIVLLNAILGYAQERKAEAALDALRRMTAPRARVRRDGAVAVIDADELVPGDIVEIEAGDAVPADLRLLQASDLAATEASLTGESTSSSKDAAAPIAPDAPLADRATMLFHGTTVVRGRGRAVVVATGASTEIGKIGAAIAGAGGEPTPLERKLRDFGQRVLWACLAVSAALFAWGALGTRRPWHELLLEAVSFAVAAIPEGLPAITTITLALGMQRMARRGAVVRRLPAVETLGAATVICTDKTGTLTQNEMTVRAVFTAGQRYEVSGEGYAPDGQIRAAGSAGGPLDSSMHELLESAVLCTSAVLRREASTGSWEVLGDPTEGALLTLASKAGILKTDVIRDHRVVRELPFDSDRKRMTVITADAKGAETAHVKGSVEALLVRCALCADRDGARALSPEDRAAIQAEADRMSAAALRVLAVARRQGPILDDPERGLTFLGLVGMIDPPRAGVKEAVRACHEAGIRPIMITGDHALTASAIAREIGLWAEGDEVMSGSDLARTDDGELERRVARVRVFARTSAEQKLRIVKALKACGHVVAMTGDGVNDAPALREAHIGVAMGRSGTDVARDAADIVLADDNFSTIVDAIREGRSIYRNIQKFIFFLLSSNAGLSLAVFAVSLSGRWRPLTPLMLLWINLVTNGLPALALGVDPPDPREMTERPRSTREGLLVTRDYLGIAWVGALMGMAAVYLYAWPPPYFEPDADWSRVMAFVLLAVAPLFHAWSCRSPTASILQQRPAVSLPLLLSCALSAGLVVLSVAVPSLRGVFRTHAMAPSHWVVIVALSLVIVLAVEISKAVYRASTAARAARGAPFE